MEEGGYLRVGSFGVDLCNPQQESCLRMSLSKVLHSAKPATPRLLNFTLTLINCHYTHCLIYTYYLRLMLLHPLRLGMETLLCKNLVLAMLIYHYVLRN